MDKAKSIDLLNRAVADELQAVHQYMYFHFHLDDQGLDPLATLFKRIAIQEMGHVEHLAERILFLGGDVVMAVAGPVEQIREPETMLARAAQMEDGSARDYNGFAIACAENAIRPPSRSSSSSSRMRKGTSTSSTSRCRTSESSAPAI